MSLDNKISFLRSGCVVENWSLYLVLGLDTFLGQAIHTLFLVSIYFSFLSNLDSVPKRLSYCWDTCVLLLIPYHIYSLYFSSMMPLKSSCFLKSLFCSLHFAMAHHVSPHIFFCSLYLYFMYNFCLTLNSTLPYIWSL